MPNLEIKRGETFVVQCLYSAGDAPADLTGVTVASQVRERSGKLLADLTYQRGTGTGVYTVSGSTDTWPLGIVYWDVRYSAGGTVSFTDTMEILVVEAQTR